MGAWNDDDRLKIRAIREGWHVPPDRLPAVVERVLAIATSDDDSQATKAARALIAAGKLQLDTVKVELLLEERRELLAALAALEASADEPRRRPPARTDPPDGGVVSDGEGGGAAGPGPA